MVGEVQPSVLYQSEYLALPDIGNQRRGLWRGHQHISRATGAIADGHSRCLMEHNGLFCLECDLGSLFHMFVIFIAGGATFFSDL